MFMGLVLQSTDAMKIYKELDIVYVTLIGVMPSGSLILKITRSLK